MGDRSLMRGCKASLLLLLGRRQVFVVAAIAALTLATNQALAAANRFAAPQHDRPNFLLLLSDDQTFRTLHCLGELPCRTPNLDRLARRGSLFTHCFNQGGYSGAVCIPSRTMLNTGRRVWQCSDTNRQGVAEGVALWGETLRRAGYQTYMAGKWHLPAAALERSFETVGPLTGGFLPSTTNAGLAYYRPAPGNPWTPDDPRWSGHWLELEGKSVHSSVRIADAAIDFLEHRTRLRNAPFFMYVAFNAPHDPRQAPPEYLAMYPAGRLKVPPNFLPKHPFRIDTWDLRDEILAPYPRTPEIIQTHLQEYYAIISHLDAQIGRVLDALEASGQSENTVVIFTSDQGLAVGQHGLMGKQNLYDHSVRMPFLMAGPGIPKGRRNSALFYMQSLFATTCDMAGVPIPSTVQFPSLVPVITGEKRAGEVALYGAYLDLQRSIRTDEWKLIRTPKEAQVQLFRVRKDPWEQHNLAANPRYAWVVERLDAQLKELMILNEDPLMARQVFGRE